MAEIDKYIPARRISFTVTVRPGGDPAREQRYDADRLEAVVRNGDSEPMLSFVSSGQRLQFLATEVRSVVYSNPRAHGADGAPGGADWCPTCDNRITFMMREQV